jgi:hypothetical protein
MKSMAKLTSREATKTHKNAPAKRRFLDRIRNAPDRGTYGKVSWARDELHDR